MKWISQSDVKYNEVIVALVVGLGPHKTLAQLPPSHSAVTRTKQGMTKAAFWQSNKCSRIL